MPPTLSPCESPESEAAPVMPLDHPRSTSQVTTSKCHLTSTCHHHHHPKVPPPSPCVAATICHPPGTHVATHVWEQPQGHPETLSHRCQPQSATSPSPCQQLAPCPPRSPRQSPPVPPHQPRIPQRSPSFLLLLLLRSHCATEALTGGDTQDPPRPLPPLRVPGHGAGLPSLPKTL